MKLCLWWYVKWRLRNIRRGKHKQREKAQSEIKFYEFTRNVFTYLFYTRHACHFYFSIKFDMWVYFAHIVSFLFFRINQVSWNWKWQKLITKKSLELCFDFFYTELITRSFHIRCFLRYFLIHHYEICSLEFYVCNDDFMIS